MLMADMDQSREIRLKDYSTHAAKWQSGAATLKGDIDQRHVRSLKDFSTVLAWSLVVAGKINCFEQKIVDVRETNCWFKK